MSRHRVGVRQDDYDEDDYYSQSPGSYPGDSLSSSVERQYMFNRWDFLVVGGFLFRIGLNLY